MTGRSVRDRDDPGQHGDHRPSQPSGLRQSHTPSSRGSSQDSGPAFRSAVEPQASSSMAVSGVAPSESTGLLSGADNPGSARRSSDAHPGVCTHGTFSPRPTSPEPESFTFPDTSESGRLLDSEVTHVQEDDGWKGWFSGRMRTKRMGQSRELAQRAGFKDTPLM